MVGHEAVGVADPVVAFVDVLESIKEILAVLLVLALDAVTGLRVRGGVAIELAQLDPGGITQQLATASCP